KGKEIDLEDIIIGLDIGGTSTKAGILSESGEIIHKWEIPTNKENEGNNILENIWRSVTEKIDKWGEEKKIRGIGAGAPGFVDKKRGMVHEAVNIGWKNFDLGNKLSSISQLPTFIENDANLAALGENKKG